MQFTFLEAVNRTLRKLRAPAVTATSDLPYSQLIGDFVNEAKREIEDAWNWLALRSTVTVSTLATESRYSLSGISNSRFKVMNVLNDTSDYELYNDNSNTLTKRFLFGSPQGGQPYYYGFNGFDGSGNPVVDLFPIPDAVYEIRFNLIVPQNDITLDNAKILVPGHLVVLGAYVKALAERGEEGNQAYQVALSQYQGALASAVSQEEGLMPCETDFYAE